MLGAIQLVLCFMTRSAEATEARDAALSLSTWQKDANHRETFESFCSAVYGDLNSILQSPTGRMPSANRDGVEKVFLCTVL